MAAREKVLILDCGSQYTQLIARRVREARVYSEIVPHTMPVGEMLERGPAAIILSGGPSSVYADGEPDVGRELFEAGVPAFGICYGFQAMARALGGTVERTGRAEYGRTDLEVVSGDSTLFHGLPLSQQVWMSHGDAVTQRHFALEHGVDVDADIRAAAQAAADIDTPRIGDVDPLAQQRFCEPPLVLPLQPVELHAVIDAEDLQFRRRAAGGDRGCRRSTAQCSLLVR